MSQELKTSETSLNPRQVVWEVFLLGLVSFLTDLSSETIFAVLPIYFVAVLGGTTVALGIMEGLADFASSSLDMASGYLSDRTGKRKWFAFSGYAFSTAAKSLLLIAGSAAGVMAFRVLERLGKSVRGAPRDAILSAIAPKEKRGTSFGLHKALDKAGAVLGPLLAYVVLDRFGESASTFQGLFLAALLPAILAVIILGFFVKDRSHSAPSHHSLKETFTKLGPRFRHYLIATAIFSLGYFSFAFLLLKAKLAGFEAKDQALLYGLLNLVFVAVSIPIGWLGDRIGRRQIVIFSYILYALLSIGFCYSHTGGQIVMMFVLYGVFFAMDEGQAKAYLADHSSPETRATAIGIYGFVTGLIYLPASLLAGLLWAYDPAWVFYLAAGTSIVALVVFLITGQMTREQSNIPAK